MHLGGHTVALDGDAQEIRQDVLVDDMHARRKKDGRIEILRHVLRVFVVLSGSRRECHLIEAGAVERQRDAVIRAARLRLVVFDKNLTIEVRSVRLIFTASGNREEQTDEKRDRA